MIRLKNLLMETVTMKGDIVTISEKTMVTATPTYISPSTSGIPLYFIIKLQREPDTWPKGYTYKIKRAYITCKLFKTIEDSDLGNLNANLQAQFGKSIQGWSGPGNSFKTAVENVNAALNERITGAGVFTCPKWMDASYVNLHNINFAGYGTEKTVDFGMEYGGDDSQANWDWNNLLKAGVPVRHTSGGDNAARQTVKFIVHTIKHPEDERILFYRMKFADGGDPDKWFMVMSYDGNPQGATVNLFANQFRAQSKMVYEFLLDIFKNNEFKNKVMADTRTK
jgi:hypothetical protein